MNLPHLYEPKNILNKIAFYYVKSKKKSVIVISIVLSTLLFTSLNTIVFHMQDAIQKKTIKDSGTSAHAAIMQIGQEEYLKISNYEGIKDIGRAVVAGGASGDAFEKMPAEVVWADPVYADLCFSMPTVGQLPTAENELATNTAVLAAMGVTPELGAELTLSINTGTGVATKNYILCGYWEGNEADLRQSIFISYEYLNKLVDIIEGSTAENLSFAGYTNCVFTFSSELRFEQQAEQLSQELDLEERIIINIAHRLGTLTISTIFWAVLAGLFIFITSYLLIYNILYISIMQDIQLFGQLRTIGAVSKQIRSIVYKKAFLLSAVGIPIGLAGGFGMGVLLIPVIAQSTASDIPIRFEFQLMIYIAATLMVLFTVFMSCRKPAKLAEKMSSVEALHYTKHLPLSGKAKHHVMTPFNLAARYLSQNLKRLIIVTLSISFGSALLNGVYTFVRSLDFDVYVKQKSVTDFSVADKSVINYTNPVIRNGVDSKFLNDLTQQEGIKDLYHIYSMEALQELNSDLLGKLTEWQETYPEIDRYDYLTRKNHYTTIYGMEKDLIPYLDLIDGKIDQNAWEAGTGIYITTLELLGTGDELLYQPGEAVEIKFDNGNRKRYEVLAVVEIPDALRGSGSYDLGQEYILPVDEYKTAAEQQEISPMMTLFNADDSNKEALAIWLENYCTETNDKLDFRSLSTLRKSFDDMAFMYQVVGGTLCGVLFLIGILNFANSIIASILARQKDIGILQAIGMSGGQVRRMLIYEGLLYALFGMLVSCLLSIFTSATIIQGLGTDIPFFESSFTLLPILGCIIPYTFITVSIPNFWYTHMIKKSLTERLKTSE